VYVRVYEAGHHKHAGRVQLSGCIAGPAFFIDRHFWGTHDTNVDDPVALNHDVHRADRRRSGTIYHSGATDDQAVEWSFALIAAFWGGVHVGLLAEARFGHTQSQNTSTQKSQYE
jgi:hypothetical protein